MQQEPTDGDLLRRMRAGDEEAFTRLYRRHQGAVYRFALQMSGKTETAEEVTQEVFMALMRRSKQYDPARGALGAFLYGIARNCVLRIIERERPYAAKLEEDFDEAGSVPAPDLDVLGDLARTERLDALRQAILKLPAQYREVIVLCELHEMEYAQVASVLGCPVGTVRSRLNRARTLLMAKMRASEGCPA